MQPPDDQPAASSRFEQLLTVIMTDETGAAPQDDVVEELRELLFANGLDTDDQVPEWITTLFESLRDREPLPIREQPDRTTDADLTGFFADLQDVDVFDCYDYGEWVRIRLPNHGMLGFFSRQHAYFTTARLDEVPDDAKSDLSEAKILHR